MENETINKEEQKTIPESEMIRIEKAWSERAKHMAYKPGSAKYMNAQTEFFTGAMVVFNIVPPLWMISIWRGDDIIKERKKMDEKKTT